MPKTRKVTDAARVAKVQRLMKKGVLSIEDLRAWEISEVSRFVARQHRSVRHAA